MAELPHSDVDGWARNAPPPIAALTDRILLRSNVGASGSGFGARWRISAWTASLSARWPTASFLPPTIPKPMWVHPGTSRNLAEMMRCQGITAPRWHVCAECGTSNGGAASVKTGASAEAALHRVIHRFAPMLRRSTNRAEQAGSNCSRQKLSGALRICACHARIRDADGG